MVAMTYSTRFKVAASELAEIRDVSHLACQWPSRAARSNLEAAEDDSHSSLSWNSVHEALVSQPLNEAGFQVGFSFMRASLFWTDDAGGYGEFPLAHQMESTIGDWLDNQLSAVGLKPATAAEMPYTLGHAEAYYLLDHQPLQLAALGDWFEHAHSTLDVLALDWQDDAVSPLAQRCWPHHFDIAVLVPLQQGDPETAPSIGVGLSPGDGSYAEPYFYCTPWPAPGAASLPPAPEPFHWHTQGFTSLVCPAGRLDDESPTEAMLRSAYRVSGEVLST